MLAVEEIQKEFELIVQKTDPEAFELAWDAFKNFTARYPLKESQTQKLRLIVGGKQ